MIVPKFLPVFLFVSHVAANGEVVEAPPAEMDSLVHCEIEKKKVERGCELDSVECKVECLKGVDALRKIGYDSP